MRPDRSNHPVPRLAASLLAALLVAGAVPALHAQAQPSGAPMPDPRVGLRAGYLNAAEAAWNMRLVSSSPRPAALQNQADVGDFSFMNSDLAFRGNYVFQGNFHGIQIWDVSQAARPSLLTTLVCPGAQNDVSVYRNLLFVSVEDPNGRLDCAATGIRDSVSTQRVLGIRIFDITDIRNPRPITTVQTCRGSHTHTLATSPRDTANVYIYVSGSAPVRSGTEMPGCSGLPPERDPNSALFRIDVIQVPLAAPERARIVTTPRIFTGLTRPATHGEAPEDIAEAARHVAEAQAAGMYTATVQGQLLIIPPQFSAMLLDSIMRSRGGSGTPSGADSATLRQNVQAIVDRLVAAQGGGGADEDPNAGPSQCHDITVYPAIGLAGGACGGYGLLLDISDISNPRRLAAAADSNFAFWHSATFNNEGTTVLFTDEWGGGLQAKCRATDRPEWGANAIFSIQGGALTFRSYFKLPAAQTSTENCVAHNGNLIPIPGRDIMVQGWYQGGVSLLDFTNPARPFEIAYFDRGPMDTTRMLAAGSWSVYWYNGLLYSSEIARGLDILELLPSAHISRNELDAARLVRVEYLNAQHQDRIVWPAAFAVPRAYLDQLERGSGMVAANITAARRDLERAESAAGQSRRNVLNGLATRLDGQARGAQDGPKVRALAAAVRELARAQ